MKRLATLALPLLLATPSFAADFDRPRYSEREFIEREVQPPRLVEREVTTRKIVEHHHYHHRVAPRVYTERIYEEPRAYRSTIDRYTVTHIGAPATASGITPSVSIIGVTGNREFK